MSALSLDQIGRIFTDAMIEVLATSTGLDFSVSSEDADINLNDMVSFLSLYGENNGMLFISASEKVSLTLCAQMTGTKASEIIKSDVDDALCELANMVAGNAKLRFNNAGTVYTLSPLFLVRGSNMTINSKKRVNLISRLLVCDKMTIKLKIVFF